MTRLAALLAAALVAVTAGRAAADPAPLGATGDIVVDAGRVTWSGATGRYALEDGVVLRRGAITLRARSASYDPTTGEVLATGGVLLTDPGRAISAEGIRAVMGGAFRAEGVVAFLKEGPVALGDASTIEEARRTGHNRASFRGAALEGRTGGDGGSLGRLRLSTARLTLCDCAGEAPSWELRAKQADIIPGERAVFSWPVLYITPRFLLIDHPVPVLVLPWLYVPLGERHTGLLIPQIGSTGATGFTLAQPIFVTLGRSADLTLTPEYMFGGGSLERGEVRGPGLRLEGRWAPAEGAEGEVELHGVNDLDREAGGAAHGRLGITGEHVQRLGRDTTAFAKLELSTDPVWNRDFTSDVLGRAASYARSAGLVSHRADGWVAEGAFAYLEPLAPHGQPEGLDFGVFGARQPVFHRWPGAALTLLPAAAGPLEVEGRAGVARFGTTTGDARAPGFGVGDPGAALVAANPARSEDRLAATRADGRVEARLPLAMAGGAVSVEPFLRGAGTAYLFDDGGRRRVAAWGLAGIAARTELSRRYAAGEHRIVPRLELRAGTGVIQDGPALDAAYDPWDRSRTAPRAVGGVLLPPLRTLSAAPDGRFTQLRLALENRFATPGGLQLRLEVGQDADLGNRRTGETFFSAGAAKGALAVDLSARVLAFEGRTEAAASPRYKSALDAFTEVRAALQAADARGDTLRAALVAVGPGASGTLMAGVDPLFDLRPAAVSAAAQGVLGLRAVAGPAQLGYEALVPVRPTDIALCNGVGGTRRIEGWQVQQHTLSAAWDSPCKCFLARVQVRITPCGLGPYSATLDLSRLGERASIH